jgi:predicted RNase H-like HicB family nuclease
MTITLIFKDIPSRFERDAETGRYFAINDRLSVIAEGDTRAEAAANFQKALAGLIGYCLDAGLPLPKAFGHGQISVS